MGGCKISIHVGFCICLIASLLKINAEEYIISEDRENSPHASGDVVMRDDAEEVFYNVDLQKYDDLGIQCPELVPPENGAIIGEGNRVGSVVYVECSEGYRMNGPAVAVCMPDSDGAQWHPLVPTSCVVEKEQYEAHIEIKNAPAATRPKSWSKNSISSLPSSNLQQNPWIKRHGQNDVDIIKTESWDAAQKHTSHVSSACLEKPDTGPCRASLLRYYFSQITRECRAFIFGGCRGNSNNFQTIKDCNLTCLGHN